MYRQSRHRWVVSGDQLNADGGKAKTRSAAARSQFSRRLHVEPLEVRWLLANVTVGNVNDVVNGTTTSIAALIATPGGDGISLREAVLAANADSASDVIDFAPSVTGTIQLTNVGHVGQIAINNNLTINGPGAGLLTVQAFAGTAAAGDGARIFRVDDGNFGTFKDVSFSGLTITGGDRTVSDGSDGGGILSFENLSLTGCTISGNQLSTGGSARGGGVFSSFGSLTLTGCTISGNTALRGGGVFTIVGTTITGSTISGNTSTSTSAGPGGGGIVVSGTTTITNSTISGNQANANGGGLVNDTAYGLTVRHSTITANRADADNTGGGDGGGIHSTYAATSLDHTIVAGNLRGASTRSDLAGGATPARFSLIGDNTGATITNNGGNLIGTGASPINAALAPLADNGGPTMTHELLFGGPAVDAGDPAAVAGVGTVPLNDQRGLPFSRVIDGHVSSSARIDIGAIEVPPQVMGSVVDILSDEDDGNYSEGDLALREAIVGLGLDTINFAPSLTSGGPATILLTLGELPITDSMTISGPGATLLTIDASGNDPTPVTNNGDGSRVFNIDDGNSSNLINVAISGLTLTGGDSPNEGGAVLNRENLTVTASTISGNNATGGGGSGGGGGGLSNRPLGEVASTVLISNSVVSGNSSVYSGGGLLANNSNVTITGSTVSGNTAVGNVIGGEGGGLLNQLGTMTVIGSTISGNSALGSGGGIRNFSNLIVTDSTVRNNSTGFNGGGLSSGRINVTPVRTMMVTGSTISGNSAAMRGGGISTAYAETTIVSSTISGNLATLGGGGILNLGATNFDATATIRHSTITANTAPAGEGSGVASQGNSTTLTVVHSTIISANTNSDVDAIVDPINSFNSDGFNLIGTGDALSAFSQPGDQTGMTDPTLGPLANNGGPTMMHALLPFSPAIDAGDPTAVAGAGGVPQFDQRGTTFPRVVGGRIDIGAFEARLFADYNRNGAVDAADWVLWRKTFGLEVPPSSSADGTGDGVVNAADLGLWRRNFGKSLSPGAGSATAEGSIVVRQELPSASVSIHIPERGSGPRSIGSFHRHQVVESSNEDLLRLLAIDRVRRLPRQDLYVSDDNADDDRYASELESESLIDQPVVLALARWQLTIRRLMPLATVNQVADS